MTWIKYFERNQIIQIWNYTRVTASSNMFWKKFKYCTFCEINILRNIFIDKLKC